MAQRTCSVDGCEGTHYARGWCPKHYQRWLAHGDPLATLQPGWPENLLARMEPQPNGCIHYSGHIADDGYGKVKGAERMEYAHRAAYEYFVGPIPEGMTIDHECHNRDESCAGGPNCLHRRCVNWEHLAPKLMGENLRSSSNTAASVNAAKTHCVHGHEFTEANTHRPKQGGRVCLECNRERCRAAHAKRMSR